MPQYQQQKKGQARVRILPKDATRAYLLLMQKTAGKMQVLPGDVYVIEEKLLPVLEESGIGFERMDTPSSPAERTLSVNVESQSDTAKEEAFPVQSPAFRRHWR